MPRIHVIGALVYDLVFNIPDWIEPNRAVHASRVTLSPGGKALNQAAAARLLGADVALIGCVGDDLFGAQMLRELRNIGLNIDHVITLDSARTSLASIVVKDMVPGFIGAPDASRKIGAGHIDKALRNLHKDDLLLIDFEIPQELVHYALALARNAGATTLLNPAPFFTRDAFLFGYLHLVDVIIPNKFEAQLIAGDDSDDPDLLARRLLNMGIRQVLMTLGEDGCVLYEGERKLEQSAFAVPVVDTTGASDAFVGAYALAMVKGWPGQRALKFATAAAGLACGKHGTMSSLPRLRAVNSLLRAGGK
ncbi:MAG: ribokinase [Chloroflexota bacterium]|nr:ribokinase [Chloroflexota bacterium]